MDTELQPSEPGPDARDSLQATERLRRLKQIQRKSASASRGRQVDRQQQVREAEVVEQLRPEGNLASQCDRIERLLHALRQDADFTDEDVQVVRAGVRNEEEASATVRLLTEACYRAGARVPDDIDWLAIKKHQAEDVEYAERRAQRAQAAARADTTTQMLQGLPVHDGERRWVAAMLESLSTLGRSSRSITAARPGVRRRTAEDHEAIVAAVERRDPDGARAAMTAHLERIAAAARTAPGLA